MESRTGHHDIREEILEEVWYLCEDGDAKLATLVERLEDVATRENAMRAIEELKAQGCLRVRDDAIALTDEGEHVARHVVRAHRLAARLLTDLLELPPGITEGNACRLEHAISPELADSLCTLLGHPPTGPEGKPIPRGACCEAGRSEVSQAVYPVPQMDLGSSGRVVFIHPRRAGRIEQLSTFGLVPGTDLRLRQRHPAIVIEIGETTLAIDHDVARDVFVKPVAAPTTRVLSRSSQREYP